MAKDQSKRISPGVLAGDRDSFDGVKEIAGYAPANPHYSMEALSAAETAMRNAQEAENRAEGALAIARDNAAAAEWAFHNLILGMRDQVTAQFGRNSNEVQLVGLKKTSEYRRRSTPSPES
ncbi:MAG TPA: hypothetical protein VF543_05125 [Pyrinomonadaceae bacterium]|jgi:hypothetical protein